MIRGITGVGEGKGPYIVIHDGFQGLDVWPGFMTGADRLALDMHPYLAFGGGAAMDGHIEICESLAVTCESPVRK